MHSSFCRCLLSLLAVFNPSSADLVTYQGEELSDLVHSNAIDLTVNGSSTVLYVRLCPWRLMDSTGKTRLLSMTRYCYCTQSTSIDHTFSSCSYPGPTLLMHSYTSVTVTLVNELVGSQTTYGPTSIGKNGHWNHYKDMDTTNLHVHGLHVSPYVDDVIFAEAAPIDSNYSVSAMHRNTTWTYHYDVYYHYPGTHWYHAHHHGSTTWQVTMGLQGAILMNPWDDSRYPESATNTFYDIGKYEQDVLMFQWMYAIGQSVCQNEISGCAKGRDENYPNFTYTPRFTDIPYRADETWTGPIDDFQTCDIWCQMPSDQRDASDYDYDVYVDEGIYPQCQGNESLPDMDCMFFFTNGQYQPTLKGVQINEYRRLRMINSMANWYLQLLFPKACEWYLIATDGIYTDGENRNYPLNSTSHQNELIMSPGGRADVLYRCTYYGTHVITSSRNTEMDAQQLPKMTPKAYAGRHLLSIQIDGEGPTWEPTLEPTREPTGPTNAPTVPTPKPTKGSTPTPTEPTSDPTKDPSRSPTIKPTESPTLPSPQPTASVYTLPGANAYPPKPPTSYVGAFTGTNITKTCGQSDDTSECKFGLYIDKGTMFINGKQFLQGGHSIAGKTFKELLSNSSGYTLGEFNTNHDDGYEFIINNGKNSHPYHQHINPFNLRYGVGNNSFIALQNTWWDTLGNYGGPLGQLNDIVARMWTRGSWVYPDDTAVHRIERRFFGTGGGLIIVHCHMLQHEDQGMMGFYGIINRTDGNLLTLNDTDSDSDEDESGSESDDSTGYIVLYVVLAVIALALIIFAIYYFVNKKAAASANQKNMTRTQGTEGGATAATSGSIEREAGSTEMTTTTTQN